MKHGKTSSYTLTEEPALKWMIIVSVAAHVCVLVGAFVIPNLGAAPAPFEPAYSVELVDMPPAAAPKATPPAPKRKDRIMKRVSVIVMVLSFDAMGMEAGAERLTFIDSPQASAIIIY